MALNKRFVYQTAKQKAFDRSSNENASLYLLDATNQMKTGVTAKELESIIFAGTGDDSKATRDIISHGRSWVQEPLDMREQKITGLDSVDLTSATLPTIGTKSSATADGATATTDANGLTSKNLMELVRQLNDLVIYNKATQDTAMAVTIEKGAATTDYAATYTIKQGGTALAQTINIPKDQFLKQAFYVAKDDDFAGTGVTKPADITYPALVFEWQYSSDLAETPGNPVSWVPADDLVDVYAGSKVTQKKSTTSYNGVAVSEKTYEVEAKINSAAAFTGTGVSVDVTTDGSASGNAGEYVQVKLSDSIIDALIEAEESKSYTDQEAKELANLIGATHASHVYTGNTSGVVLSDFKAVKRTTEGDKTVYTQETSGKSTLSSAENGLTVEGALEQLTDAVIENQREIVGLLTNSDNIQENLKEALEDLEINGRSFQDVDDKLKAIVEAGDIKLKHTRDANGYVTAEDTNYLSTNHELGIKNNETIYAVLAKLEEAWEWQNINA